MKQKTKILHKSLKKISSPLFYATQPTRAFFFFLALSCLFLIFLANEMKVKTFSLSRKKGKEKVFFSLFDLTRW